jgi:hypothetical protein
LFESLWLGDGYGSGHGLQGMRNVTVPVGNQSHDQSCSFRARLRASNNTSRALGPTMTKPAVASSRAWPRSGFQGGLVGQAQGFGLSPQHHYQRQVHQVVIRPQVGNGTGEPMSADKITYTLTLVGEQPTHSRVTTAGSRRLHIPIPPSHWRGLLGLQVAI